MSICEITKSTRLASYIAIQPERKTRQCQVLELLKKLGPCTANRLAYYLCKQGEIPYPIRNYVHPRLNELIEKGKVEVVRKEYDEETGRMCAVYKAKGE